MKKGRGSHTKWHESVFLYYVATSKVEGPNRNPAGFYFGHRVWEWRAFGCQRETLSRNWEARINMNNCCSIPPQLRSLYCKCCLNAYPFTPFVSWTFIITSLLYSSGENEQYTYYRWILSFLFSFYHDVTAAPGDYWVTFWVPVPDKWCFGITHWGEWNNSKAKNKKQKHDYPNNYIKDSLFTRKNVFIVQYLFSILLPPCAIVLLVAKFSSLRNWPVDKMIIIQSSVQILWQRCLQMGHAWNTNSVSGIDLTGGGFKS